MTSLVVQSRPSSSLVVQSRTGGSLVINSPGIGDVGNPGLSAYQIAVDNGFVGDEAAWLESLKVKGDPAPQVRIEYSLDGALWSSAYTDGDAYIRLSLDGGVTWGSSLMIRGDNGAGIPPISEGDSGKILAVKSDESGTEWVEGSSDVQYVYDIIFVAPIYLQQDVTTYTLSEESAARRIIFTSPNPCTVLLPSTGLPTGFHCLIRNAGGGSLTVVPTGNAVIENTILKWSDPTKYGSVLLESTSPFYTYFLMGGLEE